MNVSRGDASGAALARDTAAGTAWNFVSFLSAKSLSFVVTLVLARLLVPDDFGLLALGLLTLRFLQRLNSFGVGAAMIQREQDPERTAQVAFAVSLVLGIVMTTIGIAAAPAIAVFFEEPRAVLVVQALSLSFLLSALRTVQEARLRKALAFRKRLLPQIGGALAKGVISISLALLGAGVWSLVIGQLAGELATTVLYWVVSDWRPKAVRDSEIARSLLSFGGQMMTLGILTELLSNLDYIVIGRMMSSDQLGLYTLAYRLPELTILSFCYVVSQVVFPAYSRVQNDTALLAKGLLASLRVSSLVTVPAGLGMALVAADLVEVLYGPKWSEAAAPMQMLALYAMFFALQFSIGDVYKATGRVRVLLGFEALRLVILMPVLIVAARGGITGVAAGHLSVAVLYCLFMLVAASRNLDIRIAEIIGALRSALASGLVMVTVLLLIDGPLAELIPEARLAITIAVGASSYLATLWLIDRRLPGELRQLLGQRRTARI